MLNADRKLVEEIARQIAKEEIALALAPKVVEPEAIPEPPTPDPVEVDE